MRPSYLRRVSRGARRAVLYGGAALALLAVCTLFFVLLLGKAVDGAETTGTVSPLAGQTLEQRFAVLNGASSNQCGLLSTGLDRLARGGRLQGSCCNRMNLHRYVEQVNGLRPYLHVREIPADPYDIPVDLAKRLIGYQESISLTQSQQAIYARAMKFSDESGPCCCRCWRWTAFEGQAKFLISRRRYGAEQIAEIWALEDGCGGRGHVHDA